MKLLITVALLSIVGFLFAQSDTPHKQKYVVVKKDGKTVGVSVVDANADSVINLDSAKTQKPQTIRLVKNYPIWHSNMTFFEKCKYWIMWFKYENKYMFWALVVLLGLWVIKMLLKLIDR